MRSENYRLAFIGAMFATYALLLYFEENSTMNESILAKLKRIHVIDFLHIFKFLSMWPVALIYKYFHNNLWLFCEYGPEARDNAYYLFQHIRLNHPEIDAIYAIKRKGQDFEKVRQLGKTVEFGSFKHWFYYIVAKVNISSQKGGKPNAAVCYALEVSGLWKNTRVFLQHGVTKDDLPFLHYAKSKIRLFACAALPEYCFIRDTFGYPPGYVQYLGFCRFDMLHKAIADPDLILIIPTWRKYLHCKKKTTRTKDFFYNTVYFKSWNMLLQNRDFLKLLQSHKKRAVFCMHRNMQEYSDAFTTDHPALKVVCWNDADITQLIHSASILITDYSSIYMDFAYMRRPLLYYQFDYDDYRMGHLPTGYFHYEKDGFGPICVTDRDVVFGLQDVLESKGTVAPKYLERQKKFFTLYDDQNCERTYAAINEVLQQ